MEEGQSTTLSDEEIETTWRRDGATPTALMDDTDTGDSGDDTDTSDSGDDADTGDTDSDSTDSDSDSTDS